MLRSLFGRPLAGEPKENRDLEDLLKREEGAFEAVRLGRIRGDRRAGDDVISDAQGPDLQNLEALRQTSFSRIRELAAARLEDPLEGAGGTHGELQVEADFMAFGMDLPVGGLEVWCRNLSQRLQSLLLARFPLEREALLKDLEDGTSRRRQSLSALLGTALSGHPYAQCLDLQKSTLEGLLWSDLRAHARRALAPERMTLVLVGDLQLATTLPVLERTFGALNHVPGEWERSGERSIELPEAPGARRLLASTPGEVQLIMGWRVPPLTHPDALALQVVAQILGGGRTSRLVHAVVEERGLAKTINVRLGVPGSRDANLLVVEAEPAEGHGLTEVEQAILGVIMRLQREALPAADIRRSQHQVEVDQVMIQEDATVLARALGAAYCQGGDWRLAFRAIQFHQDFTPEEIRRVAFRYLVPAQSTTALLEPDPILQPQDVIEGQLSRVLTRILESKVDDPAQVESLVRETLRQLRMLSQSEREQTLKLLEAKVKP